MDVFTPGCYGFSCWPLPRGLFMAKACLQKSRLLNWSFFCCWSHAFLQAIWPKHWGSKRTIIPWRVCGTGRRDTPRRESSPAEALKPPATKDQRGRRRPSASFLKDVKAGAVSTSFAVNLLFTKIYIASILMGSIWQWSGLVMTSLGFCQCCV